MKRRKRTRNGARSIIQQHTVHWWINWKVCESMAHNHRYQIRRTGQRVGLSRSCLTVTKYSCRVSVHGHFDDPCDARALHQLRLTGRCVENGVESERFRNERLIERRLRRPHSAATIRLQIRTQQDLLGLHHIDDTVFVLLYFALAQRPHSFIQLIPLISFIRFFSFFSIHSIHSILSIHYSKHLLAPDNHANVARIVGYPIA